MYDFNKLKKTAVSSTGGSIINKNYKTKYLKYKKKYLKLKY